MLSPSEAIDMMFESPQLGAVLLFTEVCELWGKTRRQVEYAIYNDTITARKAITNGGWLVTYESCLQAWGVPKYTIEEWIKEHVTID